MFPLTTQGFDELLCEGVGRRQNQGSEGAREGEVGSGQIHHPHGLTRVFIHQPALTNTTHQQRQRQSLSLIVGNFLFTLSWFQWAVVHCQSAHTRSLCCFAAINVKRHGEMAVEASGVSVTWCVRAKYRYVQICTYTDISTRGCVSTFVSVTLLGVFKETSGRLLLFFCWPKQVF